MDADEGGRAVFHFFRKETLVLFLCLCLIVLCLGLGAALRSGSPGAGVLENDIRVDINHAPWQELVLIRGIGPKKARSITEFRLEHGPFGSPRDLEAVRGISTGLAKEIETQVVFR